MSGEVNIEGRLVSTSFDVDVGRLIENTEGLVTHAHAHPAANWGEYAARPSDGDYTTTLSIARKNRLTSYSTYVAIPAGWMHRIDVLFDGPGTCDACGGVSVELDAVSINPSNDWAAFGYNASRGYGAVVLENQPGWGNNEARILICIFLVDCELCQRVDASGEQEI